MLGMDGMRRARKVAVYAQAAVLVVVAGVALLAPRDGAGGALAAPAVGPAAVATAAGTGGGSDDSSEGADDHGGARNSGPGSASRGSGGSNSGPGSANSGPGSINTGAGSASGNAGDAGTAGGNAGNAETAGTAQRRVGADDTPAGANPDGGLGDDRRQPGQQAQGRQAGEALEGASPATQAAPAGAAWRGTGLAAAGGFLLIVLVVIGIRTRNRLSRVA
jgi:hypothetical protein